MKLHHAKSYSAYRGMTLKNLREKLRDNIGFEQREKKTITSVLSLRYRQLTSIVHIRFPKKISEQVHMISKKPYFKVM